MNKLPPLHLACKVDDDRPNLRLIEIRRGIATATNGIIIARINLLDAADISEEELAHLDGKFIDMEVWKDIHNADKISFAEDQLSCDKNGIGKYFDYSISQGEFFNIDSVIITIRDAGEEPRTFTSYNFRQLEILRKVLDTDELIMAQSKGNVGTLVYPNGITGAFGVIMPVELLSKQTRYFFTC